MISRLCRASSRLLISTRVHHDARLTFSSSSISCARRSPQRLTGEHANVESVSRQRTETEVEVEDEEFNADEKEEEERLDRWIVANEEKGNESAMQSYRDPYGHFCKNVAPPFREPSPRNWLGRDVPFPLNPSFKPPVPLSDEFRTRLYRAYMTDPKLNSVRALTTRHGISIKRVDAILRLKGLEGAWKKNKPLQTGFTNGMEHLLGVTVTAKRTEQEAEDLDIENDQPDSRNRYDVEEADLQDEVEGNNRARQRYQRLFWESVAEGEEAVMSNALATQRSTDLARTKFRGKTTLVERAPGRPAIMFVDVGNAFVDEKEKERREHEGIRRSMVKARKRTRGHNLHT